MHNLKRATTCLLTLLIAACQAADPPPRDAFDQQMAAKLPEANYETRQKVRALLRNALANQVFIEGGTFTMGDFGAVNKHGVWLPYFPPAANEDKAHQVTLSSYSLSKYKTTWEDYDTYLLATERPFVKRAANFGGDYIYEERERQPYEQNPEADGYIKNPARDRWQDAKDYCLWLGEMTGLHFDLTTDAQYEYAARNRGLTTWLYPTHDGKPIIHYSDPYADKVFKNGDTGPVGTRLPANPLGLYDLAENSREWVNDWFSPTYYSENPEITDPKGPSKGKEKVVRALGVGSLAFSFTRSSAPEIRQDGNFDGHVVTNAFRCAVNSPAPVTLKIPE